MSAAISGLLLTIVVMVILLTCRKMAKKQSDTVGWPGAPSQVYQYSISSSEDPSQSNLTGSVTVEDADESLDSLPVNYSAFIKSENIPEFRTSLRQVDQPDRAVLVRETVARQSANFIVYQQRQGGEQDYSNPYCQQSSTPAYTNLPGRENAAVIRYLEGEVSAQQLDDIKLGTHV